MPVSISARGKLVLRAAIGPDASNRLVSAATNSTSVKAEDRKLLADAMGDHAAAKRICDAIGTARHSHLRGDEHVPLAVAFCDEEAAKAFITQIKSAMS